MIRHTKTLGIFQVDGSVWKHLSEDKKAAIERVRDEKLDIFFNRLSKKEIGVNTIRNLRSYYSATIADFLRQSSNEILGIIHSNDNSAERTIQQSKGVFAGVNQAALAGHSGVQGADRRMAEPWRQGVRRVCDPDG